MKESEKWLEKANVYRGWLEMRHSNSDPIWTEIYMHALELCERRMIEEIAKEGA